MAESWGSKKRMREPEMEKECVNVRPRWFLQPKTRGQSILSCMSSSLRSWSPVLVGNGTSDLPGAEEEEDEFGAVLVQRGKHVTGFHADGEELRAERVARAEPGANKSRKFSLAIKSVNNEPHIVKTVDQLT